MSEKLPLGNSETNNEEHEPLHETHEHTTDRLQHKAEALEHNHNIDKIQESIHQEALSAEDTMVGEPHRDSPQPILGAQRELKAEAYKRTIQKVRSHLSPAERTLSKVVHHRIVEPVSELGSKTIARPSGILGGGIVALIGSGAVLYMAKHYGFHYNFTTFLILLLAGFLAGLVTELLVRLMRRNRT